MIVLSDLHLRESSEDVCFRVLDEIESLALGDDKHIVCCGDFWHIRYQLNVRLLNRVAELMRRWEDLGLELDLVPGNHDQVDVAGRNALEVFEGNNCLVWTEPGVDNLGHCGFVPYRKDRDEQLECLRAVAEETPAIIFGHFGIQGATMNNGQKDRDGLEVLTQLMSPRSHLVLGHYHKRQSGNGWEYVGSPYQTSFGEAGNACGVLHIDSGFERAWTPIEVQAPTHHILKWDPAKDPEPPVRPQHAHAKVRLDIEASHEMIVSGKFKGVLKTAGLADVEIQVVPTKVDRQERFALEGGETLLSAAERFAVERFATEKAAGSDVERAMEALRRWAGA
jgi:DNA repair exonuclease SbcCD nuclease subunit